MNSNDDYSVDIQHLLIRTMVTDAEVFSRSQNILKPDYFDDVLRPAVKFVLDYSAEYSSLPSTDLIYANTKINISPVDNVAAHGDWYMKTIEKFCRYRALELAVLDGV